MAGSQRPNGGRLTAGAVGQRRPLVPREILRNQDRLDQPAVGERARPLHLGHDDRAAAEGMADAVNPGAELEGVDHGQHVVPRVGTVCDAPGR